MKKYLILAIFLSASFLHAGDDRFGSHRDEVLRSSFSYGPISMVEIASATFIDSLNVSSLTAVQSGKSYVRRVVFSGVNPTTVTFYDGLNGNSTANLSTRAIISYIPTLSGGGGGVTGAGNIDVDVFFSSAIVLQKECVLPCPMIVNWDYLTLPAYGGIGK